MYTERQKELLEALKNQDDPGDTRAAYLLASATRQELDLLVREMVGGDSIPVTQQILLNQPGRGRTRRWTRWRR